MATANIGKVLTRAGRKKKSSFSRKSHVKAYNLKKSKRNNVTSHKHTRIYRTRRQKHVGGEIGDIITEIKKVDYVDILVKYIDEFITQQPEYDANRIYSDHVQLKRKIDDNLNVFTNNCSFVLTAWANVKKHNGDRTFCIKKEGEKWVAKFGSEALLVNALVNSIYGNTIATNKPDSDDSFLHKFLRQEVEDNPQSIICLQEPIVDIIKSYSNITDEYHVINTQCGPEGSVILVNKKNFILPEFDEYDKEQQKKHYDFTSKIQPWGVCQKNDRAWSYVVVEPNITQQASPISKYLIINIHGTHPITDAKHLCENMNEKTVSFGENQTSCFRKWLQDTFNVKREGNTFTSTIYGLVYKNITKIILAGDFNDEVGVTNDNFCGQMRKEMGEYTADMGESTEVLWKCLCADVRQHDVNKSFIQPTNGHLALDKETRAAGDMILCAVPNNSQANSNKMELASSALPNTHFFNSYIHRGVSDVNKYTFNQKYKALSLSRQEVDEMFQ